MHLFRGLIFGLLIHASDNHTPLIRPTTLCEENLLQYVIEVDNALRSAVDDILWDVSRVGDGGVMG